MCLLVGICCRAWRHLPPILAEARIRLILQPGIRCRTVGGYVSLNFAVVRHFHCDDILVGRAFGFSQIALLDQPLEPVPDRPLAQPQQLGDTPG
jgi:hypothetical protein